MGYENDFVDEKPVRIEIEERVFFYKPTTAGDENEWLKDILEVNPETKTQMINWGIYNKKKLQNITKVPYDKQAIQKILGIEKEWSDLSVDQRWTVFSKLKPGLYDKIINAIKAIDEPDTKSTKN